MASSGRQASGFTLVEAVIAIAIFAVIGLGSWQILDRVIKAKQQVEIRSSKLRELQRGMWLLSRDIRSIVDRPVRSGYGEQLPAISSLIPGYLLSFTHGGWLNPLDEPRGSLQRVAFGLQADDQGNQSLVRYYWPHPDSAPNIEPARQIIFEGINYFEVQFIDDEGNTQFFWPPFSGTGESNVSPGNELQRPGLPMGILLRMEIPPFGEIERVFALQDATEESAQ